MINYLTIAILIALIAAFALCLLKKIGTIEWLQVHGNGLISEMANCDFCLSWWLSLIISILAACWLEDWHVLIAAVLATPICRKLQ